MTLQTITVAINGQERPATVAGYACLDDLAVLALLVGGEHYVAVCRERDGRLQLETEPVTPAEAVRIAERVLNGRRVTLPRTRQVNTKVDQERCTVTANQSLSETQVAKVLAGISILAIATDTGEAA